MSAEAVKRFLALAQTDGELLNKVKTAVAERGEESGFEVVEIAAGYGCEFTATELAEHLAAGNLDLELSESELEAVTGGIMNVRLKGGRIKKTISPGLMATRKTKTGKEGT